MRRRQVFKYELQRGGRQKHDRCRISGACRFVFNKAWAIQKENYKAENAFIGKERERVQAFNGFRLSLSRFYTNQTGPGKQPDLRWRDLLPEKSQSTRRAA